MFSRAPYPAMMVRQAKPPARRLGTLLFTLSPRINAAAMATRKKSMEKACRIPHLCPEGIRMKMISRMTSPATAPHRVISR